MTSPVPFAQKMTVLYLWQNMVVFGYLVVETVIKGSGQNLIAYITFAFIFATKIMVLIFLNENV